MGNNMFLLQGYKKVQHQVHQFNQLRKLMANQQNLGGLLATDGWEQPPPNVNNSYNVTAGRHLTDGAPIQLPSSS